MWSARQAASSSLLFRHAWRRPSAAAASGGAIRRLNVHEYISMETMSEHGIRTPLGFVASTPEEAADIFTHKMNTPGEATKEVVLKAQVLSGGRGLGHFKNGFQGGVHMVATAAQAKELAGKMLGQELVTKQAPQGILCSKVLLAEKLSMVREMYVSLLMDRKSQGPVMIGSPAGGTSIEDVAHDTPELIFQQVIDITVGITPEQCSRMATNLGLTEGTEAHAQAVTLLGRLYEMFIARDCTQVEINPLGETADGNVLVADAKLNFDDNAEFRQADIFARRDVTQEDAREVEAAKFDLNYIGLDGNIGCMVNGAGLAMSTMDIIQLKGGTPANFLDVGGGATEEQVQRAFEILNADDQVVAILVNIFGGIMKCDIIAAGIVNAAKRIGMEKPLIVRLQGTNVEQAKQLLAAEKDFKVIMADDLDNAATKAVAVTDIVLKAQSIGISKVTFD